MEVVPMKKIQKEKNIAVIDERELIHLIEKVVSKKKLKELVKKEVFEVLNEKREEIEDTNYIG